MSEVEPKAEEPTTMAEMKAELNKHSDGTNIIKESIKTFSNPDGSDKKGDVIVNSTDEALKAIQQLVSKNQSEATKIRNAKKSAKETAIWNFRTSPHEEFGKTLDDLYMAFIVWAKVKKEDQEGEDSSDEKYNVSKAYRRLKSYAEWMEDTEEDLMEPPLTKASVEKCIDAWAMKSSIDNQGRFVWWINFGEIDQKQIKKDYTPEDSLRAFVYFAHQVLYDENAQEKGMVFVENVNNIGFIETFTLMPMKLSAKLDRLTIGVLPVKMAACYILNAPKWMNMFMKFMGMFMSAKMKQRIVMLDDWSKLNELLGQDCIPSSFEVKSTL